jgi:hypothetical protein
MNGPDDADGTVVAFRQPARRRTSQASRPAQTTRAGVDYLYAAHTLGRRPVGWNSQRPVDLRPVGEVAPALYHDLVQMGTELSRSIGLTLRVTEPLDVDFMPRWPAGAVAVPAQTIAVAALDLDGLGRVTGLHPDALRNLCSGHAMTATDPTDTYYDRAYVGVLTTGTIADQARGLRHQVGHALGLAHCKSTQRLMHLMPNASVRTLTPAELGALRALHSVDQCDPTPSPMCMTGPIA